jgi:hypothetical protein
MGEPSFVSLPSLLNIRCVVVMGGFGQEDSVVSDGALWELGVVTICERLILKKDGGVVLV